MLNLYVVLGRQVATSDSHTLIRDSAVYLAESEEAVRIYATRVNGDLCFTQIVIDGVFLASEIPLNGALRDHIQAMLAPAERTMRLQGQDETKESYDSLLEDFEATVKPAIPKPKRILELQQ